MKRILVNLPEDRVSLVDAKAKALGISRSELARRAMDRFVADPGVGTETPDDRLQRVRRLLAEMRESGRRMKQLDPTWDPAALIRAARDGRIRL